VRIAALDLEHFRNLVAVSLQPGPRFNVVSGDNGQGKTNLIEAVYFVGRLRSFRATRAAELIHHDAELARLHATIKQPGLTTRVDVELAPRGKRVRVDGKGLPRIGEHCSRYRMVLFTPADVDLPRGAPEHRRRFLDRAIFNRSPAYLGEAQAFDAALQRRNALLRAHGVNTDPVLLSSYDVPLSKAAARVACLRRDFVAEVGDTFRRIFAELIGGDPPPAADLRYRSTLPGVADGRSAEEVAQACQELLERRRRRDMERRSTGVGPQRDDLVMTLGGRPLKEHASQGQHRLFVLALKITEIETLRLLGGASPVLLLDDIGSELDRRRRGYLFDYLSQLASQVFLTTTSAELVPIQSEREDFAVRGGRLWNIS